MRQIAAVLTALFVAFASPASAQTDAKPSPGLVVIDPGHGGTGSVGGSNGNNATGPAGTKEKDVTLAVGLEAARRLEARGYTVHLTRSADVNLGLADRAQVAKDKAADAFVAIHCNGWHDPAVQGTETLVHPTASDASKALAHAVQRRVLEVTGYRDRGVKPQELGVLVPARHDPKTAGCLLEISFLTDPKEELRLKDPEYQAKVAEAVAAGIDEYMKTREP